MTEPMLQATDVAWSYGAGVGSGVDGITLSLRPGFITGFLGRNGAGKTTTIKLLAGVLVPQRGTITVGGLPSSSSFARARIGWAPEEPPTVAGMTVREHLQTAMDLAASTPSGGHRSIDDVVMALDLGAVVHRLAGALSKGTRQRLGVAMALCGAPDVLLLDEPTAGLDPAQVDALRSLIRAEAARGAAILLSSHVTAELAAVADDVVAINAGRTVFVGPIGSLEEATRAALALPVAPPAHASVAS
jgi:ABC-2 type transport system ATP-binding protein